MGGKQNIYLYFSDCCQLNEGWAKELSRNRQLQPEKQTILQEKTCDLVMTQLELSNQSINRHFPISLQEVMSIYLIGVRVSVVINWPIREGGGSLFAAPDFEGLSQTSFFSTSPSPSWTLKRVVFCCIFLCVRVCVFVCVGFSVCQAAPVHCGPAADRGVPHMCASAVGAPLFTLSELESTWANCGSGRTHGYTDTRTCARRASLPSPSAHKQERTIRPLINARVSSVQDLHRLHMEFLSGSTALNMVLIAIRERNYRKTGTFSGECCVSELFHCFSQDE